MTAAELQAAAERLPPAERVRLGRSLCESGWAELPERVRTPDQLRGVLEERWQNHLRNPEAARDAFEVLSEFEEDDRREADLLRQLEAAERAAGPAAGGEAVETRRAA